MGVLSFFDLWFAIFYDFKKILGYHLLKYFSRLFYSSFSGMLGHLMFHNSLDGLFCFIHAFSFDFWVISVDLSSSPLIVSLAVLILLMSLWKAYFISNTRFYIYNISIFLTASNSTEICYMHVVHLFSQRFSHVNPNLIVLTSESDSVDSFVSL